MARMDPSAQERQEAEEIVAVERTWSKVVDQCQRADLRTSPPDLEGLRKTMDLDRAAFEERLVKHDGTHWLKSYLSYHDPAGYHAFDEDEMMARDRAEELGADPCPACYPDNAVTQWAQVHQGPNEDGGTTTAITPKPPGSDAEDGAADDASSQSQPFAADPDRPDEESYFATARLLYTNAHPKNPEAGRMRTIDEQHEYLQEIGVGVAVDPDGTVHLDDVPGQMKLMMAAMAVSMGRPLHEMMGFEEMPHREAGDWTDAPGAS